MPVFAVAFPSFHAGDGLVHTFCQHRLFVLQGRLHLEFVCRLRDFAPSREGLLAEVPAALKAQGFEVQVGCFGSFFTTGRRCIAAELCSLHECQLPDRAQYHGVLCQPAMLTVPGVCTAGCRPR